MGRRAFLFPGQGSQAVGMGKSLWDAYPEAKAVFEAADAALGFSLSRLCFEGPEEELKRTPVTQPAILTASVAVLSVLRKEGAAFDAVAGHSLGAYSALVAAGVIGFNDAVRLVRRRGELMEQVGAGRGTMAAILGLPDEKVEEACRAAATSGVVEPANVNCPGQVVISGEKAAVEEACRKAKELGARKTVVLAVSGPFHSSLMAPTAEAFRGEIARVPFKAPALAYYSDTEARKIGDPEAIRESLVRQLTSPVQWTGAVEAMVKDGIDRFVEVGPGRVLTGLAAKIHPGLKLSNVGDAETLRRFKEEPC